jgi:hypothetical protein
MEDVVEAKDQLNGALAAIHQVLWELTQTLPRIASIDFGSSEAGLIMPVIAFSSSPWYAGGGSRWGLIFFDRAPTLPSPGVPGGGNSSGCCGYALSQNRESFPQLALKDGIPKIR